LLPGRKINTSSVTCRGEEEDVTIDSSEEETSPCCEYVSTSQTWSLSAFYVATRKSEQVKNCWATTATGMLKTKWLLRVCFLQGEELMRIIGMQNKRYTIGECLAEVPLIILLIASNE